MTDWTYLFLGFLQGITEFLPISSSGHLFLLEQILKNDKAGLFFILILHAATFFSVCVVFFKDITSLIFGLQKKKNLHLLYKVFLSLSPLIFVGLFLKPFVEQSFQKNVVAFGFFSSAVLLFSLFFVKKKKLSLEEMGFLQAFLIGLAQSVAVFPGFSRSGWTIAMGLYCGLAPRAAVYYSFLISLPAIAGSVLVDLLYFQNPSVTGTAWFAEMEMTFSDLSFSFFIAFFSGLLSLFLVLKMVQSEKLYLFSFYLLPLSLMVFFFL